MLTFFFFIGMFHFEFVVRFAPPEEVLVVDDGVPVSADLAAGGQQGVQGQAGEHHLQQLGRQTFHPAVTRIRSLIVWLNWSDLKYLFA